MLNHLNQHSPTLKTRFGLMLFISLGFGLRLHNLSFQPLWGDEGWSFYFTAQSLPQLVALTAIDIHPPLYYLLLKGWRAFSGNSAETARFFSVVVGTALIPMMYALGQRLFTKQVGLTVAFITAVMPLAIYYSQEVRMYGLVTLLGTMSVYALARLKKEVITHHARCGFVIRNGYLADLQSASRLQIDSISATDYKSVTSVEIDSISATDYKSVTSVEVGEQLRKENTRFWEIIYIVTTAAALYTMYYAVFIVAFQIILLACRINFSLSRLKGQTKVCPTIIGLLYLPWVIYATPRLINYIQNKRAVEGYQPLPPFQFFGDHAIAFSVGHLPTALHPHGLAIPFMLLAALGFIVSLKNGRPHRFLKTYKVSNAIVHLYLVVPLMLGYVINQIYPFTPRFYERTLFLAAPAYWLFMAIGLVWLRQQRFMVYICSYGLILLITGLSLMAFYNIPRYPNEDYRRLLANIAARATPEDTLLASYQWQFGFYQAYLPWPRPHIFIVPGWGEGWDKNKNGQRPQMNQDLTAILEQSPRLWFPAHQTAGHIWEDAAEKIIAELGYPTLLEWYSPQIKLTLAGGLQTKNFTTLPPTNFDNTITLLESNIGVESADCSKTPPCLYQAGRGIIPLQLKWRPEKILVEEHLVSLRLADANGLTWAIRDSYPRAGQNRFTDLTIGQTLFDRHGLLITAGTPPGRYRLLLSIRRVSDAHPLDLLDATHQPLGTELLLAEVNVVDPLPPIGMAALPMQTVSHAKFGQIAELVGYSLGKEPFKAGQSLPLNLFWQSLIDHHDNLTISVKLTDSSGQIVTMYQRSPLRPSSDWWTGMLLRDPHDIPLPPTLRPAQYQLWLNLVGVSRYLTTITTIDRPHNFELPAPQILLTANFNHQAKLIGLDLPPQPIQAGEPLPLTLYWQAITTFDKNWTVFVHLVDDKEKIVAQQDHLPGDGQFPTPSWLPNEIITDHYQLFIPPDTPQATYHLQIGLYDANDFSRLPLVAGGDHAVVEVQIDGK